MVKGKRVVVSSGARVAAVESSHAFNISDLEPEA
jgi:hypothetical protein